MRNPRNRWSSPEARERGVALALAEYDAAHRQPRCGDCRSLSCTGACRNLSSTLCAKGRLQSSPACPWWADRDDAKPLPSVHQERQTASINHPRGMEFRAAWIG